MQAIKLTSPSLRTFCIENDLDTDNRSKAAKIIEPFAKSITRDQ